MTVGVQNNGPRFICAVRSRMASITSGGYSGAAARPVCLEVVDAGPQPPSNLLGPMRMRDDRQTVLMGFVDDRGDFAHRHLVLGRSA